MSIAAALLPEFDREAATTRRVLAVVPEDRGAWRPHAKSYTLGDLAMHLANLPTWVGITLGSAHLDVRTPPKGGGWRGFTTTEALLASLDDNVAAARALLAAAADGDLLAPWSLRNGDQTVFTMPRVAVVRAFVLSHAIHHRGQLTVYLRLLEVPLPQVYGPTADAP